MLPAAAPPYPQLQTRHLMMVYLALPAAFVLYLYDVLSSGALRMALPFKPDDLAFWAYVFGMPHVFASFIVLADREYLSQFGRRLGVSALVLLALPPLVTWWLGSWVLQIIFTAMIVYHTVAQQFGVALMVGKRRPDLLHKINTALASIAGVAIYFLIYADGNLLGLILMHDDIWRGACHVLVGVVTALTAWEIQRHSNRNWRLYMGLNALLLLTLDLLVSRDLTFLVVAVGRVVHEVTAWQIYMHHDQSRNQTETRNWALATLSWLSISPYWLGMLLAFVLGIGYTVALKETGNMILWSLAISCSLYHYWIEGFIWRGSSPPKRQLRIV